MSMTTHLVCEDCGVRLWVGQSRYLYHGKNSNVAYDYDAALAWFLHAHLGHHLKFRWDYQAFEFDDEKDQPKYREVFPPEEKR